MVEYLLIPCRWPGRRMAMLATQSEPTGRAPAREFFAGLPKRRTEE